MTRQIGINSTILPYAQIGAGSLIGAASVLTRDIGPGMVKSFDVLGSG